MKKTPAELLALVGHFDMASYVSDQLPVTHERPLTIEEVMTVLIAMIREAGVKPVDRRVLKGNWYSTTWCPKCDKRLSDRQIMYSRSVCPICGHKWRAATVCDSVTKVFREVRYQRRVFRLFWITERVEYELKGNADG